MLTGRSVNSGAGFLKTRFLIVILSLAGLLPLMLVSSEIYPTDSDYGQLLSYRLPSTDKVINYFTDTEHQNNPVIAIDNTYYDSDWDFKFTIYALKNYFEHYNSFSVTFHSEPENSFNYTSYYGFSPLRSPPLV